ncbi:MAG TPA: zinc-binding dehydrogenase [Ilumatobacteraceae bacterium]|jgi:NADPH:quinone reductase-like Zn-dependent oxidoreductase
MSSDVMLAARVRSFSTDDPLSGLEVGEVDRPLAPAGWSRVRVKAASLNHHDLWSLKGVGLRAEQLPMILGTDAAGIDDDGNEVIVHSVIASDGWRGDETFDPARTLLSEKWPGAIAEEVWVPAHNLVPKPAALTWEEAACMPTAWLTAYRMLFRDSGLTPGCTVLIQGSTGGVATALIVLARAAGYRVWTTGRTEQGRAAAVALGADEAFASGARLPARVDAVMETVGEATWEHSLRALRPGGTVVISGATSGQSPAAGLNRIFFQQMRVIGSTMGTRQELISVSELCALRGIKPVIDSVHELANAADAFARLHSGDAVGKVVVTVD